MNYNQNVISKKLYYLYKSTNVNKKLIEKKLISYIDKIEKENSSK